MTRILATLALSSALTAQTHDPARLLDDPARLAQPGTLPAANGETATVFRGEPGTSGFNLHSYIAHHNGRFWVIWSSARNNEEDPDQLVRYSTSRDGKNWSPAQILVDDPDGPTGPARWIARGVYVEGGKLQALAAYVESADYRMQGNGEVWKGLKLMRFEWTGRRWAPRGVFAGNCMNNFPPAHLGGAYAMACRDSQMRVSVALAEKPGAWRYTPLAAEPPFDRMDEPSFYQARDGSVHMIVRDNNRSGRLIHSVSTDQGRTWSHPVLTNFPDATSKNFTGTLAGGTSFLINNPVPRRRDPLIVTFSADGWTFSRVVVVRRDAPPKRPSGKPGTGTLQYPHAVEHGGSLWVVYSTNKQDIEVTRVALEGTPAR